MSSKKGPGRPKKDSERVDTRLSRGLLVSLDRFSAEQSPPLRRTEAIRKILHEWLADKGYLRE